MLKMMARVCRKLAVYAGFLFSTLVLLGEHVFASENSRADIDCPSMNFHEFLRVFVDDEGVQRKFTKLPLEKVQFDFKSRSGAKVVTLLSEKRNIQFPVIPLKKERKEKDQVIETFSSYTPYHDEEFLRFLPQPRYDASHHEIAAIKSDKWQVFYSFEKTETCWNLVSIDDKTLISKEGDIVPNWLEWTFFQRPSSCLPLTLYYDEYHKRSNTGILEKLGYVPYKIDQGFAYYTINEKFYGLDAIEMILPSHGHFYTITVASDARTLSDAVFKGAGIRLEQEFQEEETAYLFQKDKRKSFFICPFD